LPDVQFSRVGLRRNEHGMNIAIGVRRADGKNLVGFVEEVVFQPGSIGDYRHRL
jgi:hypothetical protein